MCAFMCVQVSTLAVKYIVVRLSYLCSLLGHWLMYVCASEGNLPIIESYRPPIHRKKAAGALPC